MLERFTSKTKVLVEKSCEPLGRISKKRGVIYNDRNEAYIKSDSDVYGVQFPTQMVPRKTRQH